VNLDNRIPALDRCHPFLSVPAHVTNTFKSQAASPEAQVDTPMPQVPPANICELAFPERRSYLAALSMHSSGPHPAQPLSHAKLLMIPSRMLITKLVSCAMCVGLA